jgi:hypothetical protein
MGEAKIVREVRRKGEVGGCRNCDRNLMLYTSSKERLSNAKSYSAGIP